MGLATVDPAWLQLQTPDATGFCGFSSTGVAACSCDPPSFLPGGFANRGRVGTKAEVGGGKWPRPLYRQHAPRGSARRSFEPSGPTAWQLKGAPLSPPDGAQNSIEAIPPSIPRHKAAWRRPCTRLQTVDPPFSLLAHQRLRRLLGRLRCP